MAKDRWSFGQDETPKERHDETVRGFNLLTTAMPELLRSIDGMTDELWERVKKENYDDWEDFSAPMQPCATPRACRM